MPISRTEGGNKFSFKDLEKFGIPDECLAIYNVIGKDNFRDELTLEEKFNIIDSKVTTNEMLVSAINERGSDSELKMFCSTSFAYYSSDSVTIHNEDSKFDDKDFIPQLSKRTEDAAKKVKGNDIRVILARMGKLNFFFLKNIQIIKLIK